jgi:hypothetical protein
MSIDNTLPETTDTFPAVDFEALYRAEKLEKESLQNLQAATRSQSTTAHPSLNTRPSMTADRVRAINGLGTVHQMSRAQKLQALGVDPSTISDDGLRALFGRKQDGKLAQDLFKTNPGRYRLLKECADILNLYAAA